MRIGDVPRRRVTTDSLAFVGQLLTGPGFGDFGDSGSLVVTDDAAHTPIGMVIGGGNNGTAIVTPIGPI